MNRQARIEPRTLRGFRDYLPDAMIPRERLMEVARRVYRSYGFSPIDTPALEYLEILEGKGGEESDKQLFKFVHGGHAVALRFDLTVPLARVAAQYAGVLDLPLKRYHIAPVWRGERPQRGRFREFVQCDFDTIGTESPVADVETALVIHDLLVALGFERFTLRINHRQVLGGLLEKLGLVERSVAVLRALDKLAKIGPEAVADEMQRTAAVSPQQAAEVLKLAELRGGSHGVLDELERLVQGSQRGEAGVARLRQVLEGCAAAGVVESRLVVDPAIARGLDYYTGTIYETFLDDLPDIGSVCSGGRYDDLAGLYTNRRLPGVGASLGLDRLLAAMEELGMLEKVTTPADVFLVYFDESRLADYLGLAARLRKAGFRLELYPEAKKLAVQLKYADRRGFRVALILGPDEFAAGVCQVKDLANQTQMTVTLADDLQPLLDTLRQLLPKSPAAPGG